MHKPCEAWWEAIQLRLDGVLSYAEERALEAHLANCDGCSEYARSMGRLTERLDDVLQGPLAASVPDFAALIEDAPAVGHRLATSLPFAAPVRMAARDRRWWLGWGVAAACALVMVGVASTQRQPVATPVATAVHSAATAPADPLALTPAVTTRDAEYGQAILAWFGPDPEPDGEE